MLVSATVFALSFAYQILTYGFGLLLSVWAEDVDVPSFVQATHEHIENLRARMPEVLERASEHFFAIPQVGEFMSA